RRAASPRLLYRYLLDALPTFGEARFTGPRQLAVTSGGTTEQLDADQIVIASGSRPVIPEAITRSGVGFHTSDTVTRIDELPETIDRKSTRLNSSHVSISYAVF